MRRRAEAGEEEEEGSQGGIQRIGQRGFNGRSGLKPIYILGCYRV
jgi:hypothetical protein